VRGRNPREFPILLEREVGSKKKDARKESKYDTPEKNKNIQKKVIIKESMDIIEIADFDEFKDEGTLIKVVQ
jgi:hypothetical protein